MNIDTKWIPSLLKSANDDYPPSISSQVACVEPARTLVSATQDVGNRNRLAQLLRKASSRARATSSSIAILPKLRSGSPLVASVPDGPSSGVDDG